jgi:hypothetical protein
METVALFTGALERDVTREIIFTRMPLETPIYSWLMGSGSTGKATAEKKEWYTEGFAARRTAINNGGAAYDANTTSIVVDAGSTFYPNSLLYAEATGEVMLVTAVSTHTLTVVRGLGSVAAHANSVANDAAVLNIGQASGEGASLYTARITDRVQNVNYVQTIRHSISLSGRLDRVGKLTGDERAQRREKKFREHLQDIEHALIFGQADESSTDANSQRVSTMGGFKGAISTNVSNIGGAMSEAEWYAFCAKAFAYGSGEKTLFAGSTLIEAVHTHHKGRVQNPSTSPVAGLTLERVLTPYGALNLVYNRRFSDTLAGAGIVVDAASARLLFSMKDGETHLNENVQTPGQDAFTDEWFTELTLEWGDEKDHAYIYGVTGAE